MLTASAVSGNARAGVCAVVQTGPVSRSCNSNWLRSGVANQPGVIAYRPLPLMERRTREMRIGWSSPDTSVVGGTAHRKHVEARCHVMILPSRVALGPTMRPPVAELAGRVQPDSSRR